METAHDYLLIIVAATLWGSLGVFAELAYGFGIVPEMLIALRLCFSSVTLLLVLAVKGRRFARAQRKDLAALVAFGIFAVALQRVSYFYAIDLTTVSMAAILFYTYPAFVTLYGHYRLGESASISEVLAVPLAFAGVALVVRAYNFSSLSSNVVGIAFGVLSSVLFVLYFVMTKRFRKTYSSWTITLYGDGVGALFLSPVIVASANRIVTYPWQLWILVVTIALVPSLMGYVIYAHALKNVKSSRASVLSVAEPLAAVVFSTTLLRENLEAFQILGIVLAVVSFALILMKGRIR